MAIAAAIMSLAPAGSIGLAAAPARYRLDAAHSRMTVHVGKAGAFSFLAGHNHVVAGPFESGTLAIDVDSPSQSEVRLVIAASQLMVSQDGEPAGDGPKVQEAMDSDKVLDVARHPRITFDSTMVTLTDRHGDALDVVIAGQLRIRDVSQTVTVPVHVQLTAGALTARGRFAIKQTAFGIKPISVGGVVAVKDTLEIDFSIAATR